MKLQEVLNIIRTEPELPGKPSETLSNALREIMASQDEEKLISLMREVVRVTKVSIITNIIKQAEQEELV